MMKKRIHQIELFKKHPFEVQNDVLKYIIKNAEQSSFGSEHNFESIHS